MSEATLSPTHPAERSGRAVEHVPPGAWRWAIYDRKTRTIHYGPADVHIHLSVAEQAGVLRNPPAYYRPGTGFILGGYLCRTREGLFYYDPYSGTFPGTNDGVREAEDALAEVCAREGWPCRRYDDVSESARVRPPSGPGRKDVDAT